ncbi:30S ribosomal protein S8 [Patescibacteria group bacterium]|nr:MAG: 30S ribosomal protein S8 [Patescibacteria group bacterium]
MSTVTTDPIADMLSRIRNALAVGKTQIVLPHSKAKEAIARILHANGYVLGVSSRDANVGKSLIIELRTEDANSPITEITRMSTPGRRMYTSADKMPQVKQGRGIVIVSTSKGVMTGGEAHKQRLGGELICKVY